MSILDLPFDDEFNIRDTPQKTETTKEPEPEPEPAPETEQEPEKKRKAGRQKGNIYTKSNKYRIEYFNKLTNTYDTLGDFPTLRQASDILSIDYNLLSNININRSKSHNKYIKIIKL
jgi:hypothetical protein